MPKKEVPWWNYSVVYWLDDQVALTFHTEKSPTEITFDKDADPLNLTGLNDFLNIRGLNLQPVEPLHRYHRPILRGQQAPGTGQYVFPAASGKGTTIVSYFTIGSIDTGHHWQDAMMADIKSDDSKVKQVVNLINKSMERLRQEVSVPLVAAAPNWVGGASCFVHGCPVFPPFPVPESSSCASDTGRWPISLPDIAASSPAGQATGKDVTVFVLDSMPLIPDGATAQTSNVVSEAASDAGGSNALLNRINDETNLSSAPHVDFSYSTLPAALNNDAEDKLVTGRDIHGKRYGFSMPDHGLFVTGIIESLVPDANIEYIRVLNDYGVGDTGTLVATLEEIHQRMLHGDLIDQPVVVNMSLVMTPSDEDMFMNWFGDSVHCDPEMHVQMMNEAKLLRSQLHVAIQALAASGAVLVASAGNDSNSIDMPGRIGPRYPAAFPEVLSVGAVDRQGEMALYSNYPQLAPQHNGIATYGGSIPTKADIDRGEVDAFIGLYSASTYPALEAPKPSIPPLPDSYTAPNKHAWAYWSGTSFATPIISAVAARVLQHLQSHGLPKRHINAEVQWALTTAEGQQEMLGTPLPIQSDFGVSLLRAIQCQAVRV